jgi:hypothetical protein
LEPVDLTCAFAGTGTGCFGAKVLDCGFVITGALAFTSAFAGVVVFGATVLLAFTGAFGAGLDALEADVFCFGAGLLIAFLAGLALEAVTGFALAFTGACFLVIDFEGPFTVDFGFEAGTGFFPLGALAVLATGFFAFPTEGFALEAVFFPDATLVDFALEAVAFDFKFF